MRDKVRVAKCHVKGPGVREGMQLFQLVDINGFCWGKTAGGLDWQGRTQKLSVRLGLPEGVLWDLMVQRCRWLSLGATSHFSSGQSQSLSFTSFSTVWTACESLGIWGSRDVQGYTIKGIITTESCPVTGLTVSPQDTAIIYPSPAGSISWSFRMGLEGALCPPRELIISL